MPVPPGFVVSADLRGCDFGFEEEQHNDLHYQQQQQQQQHEEEDMHIEYDTMLSPKADFLLNSLFVCISKVSCKEIIQPYELDSPDQIRKESSHYLMTWSLFCKILRILVCGNDTPLYKIAEDMYGGLGNIPKEINCSEYREILVDVIQPSSIDFGMMRNFKNLNNFIEDCWGSKLTTKLSSKFILFKTEIIQLIAQQNAGLSQGSHPLSLRLVKVHSESLISLFMFFWEGSQCSLLPRNKLFEKKPYSGMSIEAFSKMMKLFRVLDEEVDMFEVVQRYLKVSEITLQSFIDLLCIIAHCQCPALAGTADCSEQLLKLFRKLKITEPTEMHVILTKAGSIHQMKPEQCDISRSNSAQGTQFDSSHRSVSQYNYHNVQVSPQSELPDRRHSNYSDLRSLPPVDLPVYDINPTGDVENISRDCIDSSHMEISQNERRLKINQLRAEMYQTPTFRSAMPLGLAEIKAFRSDSNVPHQRNTISESSLSETNNNSRPQMEGPVVKSLVSESSRSSDELQNKHIRQDHSSKAKTVLVELQVNTPHTRGKNTTNLNRKTVETKRQPSYSRSSSQRSASVSGGKSSISNKRNIKISTERNQPASRSSSSSGLHKRESAPKQVEDDLYQNIHRRRISCSTNRSRSQSASAGISSRSSSIVITPTALSAVRNPHRNSNPVGKKKQQNPWSKIIPTPSINTLLLSLFGRYAEPGKPYVMRSMFIKLLRDSDISGTSLTGNRKGTKLSESEVEDIIKGITSEGVQKLTWDNFRYSAAAVAVAYYKSREDPGKVLTQLLCETTIMNKAVPPSYGGVIEENPQLTDILLIVAPMLKEMCESVNQDPKELLLLLRSCGVQPNSLPPAVFSRLVSLSCGYHQCVEHRRTKKIVLSHPAFIDLLVRCGNFLYFKNPSTNSFHQRVAAFFNSCGLLSR